MGPELGSLLRGELPPPDWKIPFIEHYYMLGTISGDLLSNFNSWLPCEEHSSLVLASFAFKGGDWVRLLAGREE
jgi:hypothetical protein